MTNAIDKKAQTIVADARKRAAAKWGAGWTRPAGSSLPGFFCRKCLTKGRYLCIRESPPRNDAIMTTATQTIPTIIDTFLALEEGTRVRVPSATTAASKCAKST